MDDDIQFDNIYVGTSPEEAAKFADETFRVKLPLEQNREKDELSRDENGNKREAPLSGLDHFVQQIRRRTNVLVDRLATEQDKLRVLQQSSDIVGFYAAVVAVLLGLVGLLTSLLGGGARARPAVPPKKTESASGTTQAEQGTSSAVKASGVTKRAPVETKDTAAMH